MTERSGWDIISEIFTAEFWAKGWAKDDHAKTFTPIQTFEINILKAKVLIASAQEIMQIWPSIHERIIEDEEGPDDAVIEEEEEENVSFEEALEKVIDFFGTGLISYFVYTEQALVTAVSATEVYLKDRFAYSIQKQPNVLKQFSDREIKVKRLLDVGPDLSNDIGTLIAEKIDFQKLDNVQQEYNRVFSFDIFSESDLEELKKIFAIRHLIVHKSGVIDQAFLSKTDRDCELGERLCLERVEVIQIIKTVEEIITNIEHKLNKKIE